MIGRVSRSVWPTAVEVLVSLPNQKIMPWESREHVMKNCNLKPLGLADEVLL